MPGKQLGDVFITISPDTRLFRTMTDAQIRKELAGFNPKVRIGADTKTAQAAVTNFQERVAALNKQLSSMHADIEDKGAKSKVVSLQAKVFDLTRQMKNLTLSADAKKLDAQIASEVAKLKGLEAQMTDLQADADTRKAAAKLLGLQAQAAHLQEALDKGKLKSDIDIKAARAKILSIDADVRALSENAKTVKLAADSKAIRAQITLVKASLASLRAQAKDIQLGTNIDPAKLLAAEAALLGIEHAVEGLGKRDVPAANTAMGAFFRSMNKGSTAAAYGWKILTGHITLFGGVFNKLLPAMFTSVAVWHLLIDAAIEVIAVWAPAIVAVTAFGAAASDAAIEVYNRMKAVKTVMDVTHQAVPPLTRAFENLHAAVRPEVYQLFGDALVVMNRRSGAFNTVAIETGRVLDQLGARFVYAVTNGQTVNKFMEHAVSDVAKLGDSFANFGSIIGAVFRAVPGYAEILLNVGDGILHVLSVATQAAEPIIAVGLALHGFFIYGGTAVTVSLALVAGVVKLVGAFGKFNEAVTLVGYNALKSFVLSMISGVKVAIGYSGALISLARSEGIAAAGSIALADAQTLLSKVPTIFWITLAASAIGGLVLWLRSAHSATQDFVAGLDKTIQAASLATVLTTISKSALEVDTRLSAAQENLARTSKYVATQNLHTGASTQMVSQAWLSAKGNVDVLTSAQQRLRGEYTLVSGRIGALSKEYGGNAQALGALNAAGITTAQITDKNKTNWALALIQVEATVAAYKAMGTQAGTLGNDLDVLGRTVTDQYQATQKLNQAWSQFISDVTGTQSSLDTVVQGFETLNTHSGELKLSLGKLKTAYADGKAAIDDLTPAGIALNQAFADQVQNVDKLFASWRTAGLANNLFTEGVKVAIAPLTKYAKGSREATAQLVALAQEAGYQGPISMAALTKWLGNTHDATRKLKDITDQATQQEALLTGSMKAQGDMIANKLIGDINEAILKYNGVEKAAAAYGDAIAKSGQQSDAARSARQRLITDIIKSGEAAGDTRGQIAAMIAKVLGIPPKKALEIVMHGEGQYTIADLGPVSKHTFSGHTLAAAGGYINLGTGPTADDVPAWLSRGEYVIKASSVAQYGTGMMDAINSGAFARGGKVGQYAAGGLVAHIGNAVFTGDTSVLSGQYAVNLAAKFQSSMQAEQVAEMRAALKRAEQAALAASAGGAPGALGGPTSASAAQAQAYARSRLGAYGWGPDQMTPLILLWNRESGWNRFARNPSSGAYGIPQALPPSKMGAAANPPTSSAAAQINWGLGYIKTRIGYGSPAAAWAHEVAHNWYSRGGPARRFASGGLAGKYAGGGMTGQGTHLITGLASGGRIPLSKWLPQLKTAQHNESGDYSGLRRAYLADLKSAKTGSWTSGHRSGILSELGTLAKRQTAEVAAVNAVLAHGTSAANLKAMASKVKAVATTSRDKDLSHSHPGWTHGLQYWLGVLTHLAQADVAPPYTGSQQKLQFAAWLAKVKADESHEVYDYRGLQAAFKAGLAHARKGSWLYQNRKAVGERLYRVAINQNAEARAFSDLVKHSTGSVADLDALSGRIGRLHSKASIELNQLQPSLLGHLPGGHPGWVKALQAQLRALTSLTAQANRPFNPPWAPGNLGPSHTAAGGVLQFDTGRGVLAPGLNLAWNGTGRNEPLSSNRAGGSQPVVLEFAGGGSDLEQLLFQIIRRMVRVRGGGNTQTAFGRGT